jgi:molybdate transport system ATP-binding protein
VHGPDFDTAAQGYARALAEDPAAHAPELIGMERVTVRYGGVEALRDVSWTVRPGERWLLTGPNGAGKSTLLSLALGDNPQAYANRVRFLGVQRGAGMSIWEVKRRIGWVAPELQTTYPAETPVRAVVRSGFFDSAGLYRRVTPEQAALAETWLRAFEIETLAGRPMRALSSGQQRLALLARALVKHPPLLVLDEPLQGLDAPHRRRILALLDRLCALAPLALVFVTHEAGDAPAAITHRLRLEGGRAQD